MTEIFRVRGSDCGRPISDIVTLVNYPELQRDFTKVLRDLSTIEREVRLRESDATFIMRIRPYRTVNGVISGTVITFVDITERKNYEEERARLAAIVDSSNDAIISNDLNSIIVSRNRSAEQLFGYTADEVVGKPITILYPPDRLDEASEILDHVRRGERVDHYETVRRRKDGSFLDVSLCAGSTTCLWLSPNDNVDGVSCHQIGFDIVIRGRKVYVSFNMYFVQCLCQCKRRVSKCCFHKGHYNFYTDHARYLPHINHGH